MAVSSVTHNKPVLPRTTDGSDLGSNRASIYSGKGLSFDGVNDKVDLGSTLNIFEKSFTISSYVYVFGDNAENSIYEIKDNNSYPNHNTILLSAGSNAPTKYRFLIRNYTGNQVNLSSGSSSIKNEWVHITATFDGTNVVLYINGQEEDSDTFSGWSNPVGAVDTNLIGLSAGDRYLNGRLSNFKIFETALTAAQVKELYNNPEQAVPTGVDATSLVLHLPMTEGAGSYLYNANANAIGTELISNAGFDETCQKWGTTDSSTVEISGGKAIWTNAPLAGSFVEQPLDLEVGKFYRVKFDYTSTAFNIFVNVGNTQQAVPLGNGTFVYDMYYGAGTSSLKFKHGYSSNSSATVDNVSVKEVVPNVYNGTINGATWVQGLPEPLPQTALMDWNKGQNLAVNSQIAVPSNMTVTADQTFAPDKSWTADLAKETAAVSFSDASQKTIGVTANVVYRFSAFVKPAGRDYVYLYTNAGAGNGLVAKFDIRNGVYLGSSPGGSVYNSYSSYGIKDAGDGWFYIYATFSYGSTTNRFFAVGVNNNGTENITSYTGDTSLGVYVWGFQLREDIYGDVYVPTFANAQSSPVLIQEGSTSGKDVFGNTISKPRASGAYNFDGKSWAEVEDNASLDITDAITLETWYYHDTTTTNEGLLGRWNATTTTYLLMKNDTNVRFYTKATSAINVNASVLTAGWHHVVGTYDGTTMRIYLDGSESATIGQTGSINTSTFPLEIGRYYASQTYAQTGQIANPRIYNYALTAEQVADNFNEKASTFGGTKVASELDAYIERTASDGATVEAHSCLINYLTELDKK